MRTVGAALLAWSLLAAERDPDLVLQRATIKQNIRATTLPNYTCVETVTREYYRSKPIGVGQSCAAVLTERQQSPQRQWVMTDRLRLDVSLTKRGEIYSWAGASKFEDAGIEQVVHRGPIGTGSFGALLAVVFDRAPKGFQFAGSRQVNGRDLLEYTFRVAKEDSHYKIRTPDSWVYTGFTGSLQIDPETSEVVHLKVESGELPPETRSCQITTTLDLEPTRIGSGVFLLPTSSRQRYVDPMGDEAENLVSFTSCREYRGESTITFGTDPESIASGGVSSAAAAPLARSIPAGQSFNFELAGSIAADNAAGGDAFFGRLIGALRDDLGKVLAPTNSRVAGRVLSVEIRRLRTQSASIVLQLRTVEVGGVPLPFAAVRDYRRMMAGRARGQLQIRMPPAWEPYSGVFVLAGEHGVLKAGLQSEWVTVRLPNATP